MKSKRQSCPQIQGQLATTKWGGRFALQRKLARVSPQHGPAPLSGGGGCFEWQGRLWTPFSRGKVHRGRCCRCPLCNGLYCSSELAEYMLYMHVS